MEKKLYIVSPLGFCSGVRRAISLFEEMASAFPDRPIHVLHELVHNRTVTDSMRSRGAVFVNAVSQVPHDGIILLGAHGCPDSVVSECRERHLDIHDATCPLVRLLQEKARSIPEDIPVVFLGDGSHQEVLGVLSCLQKHRVFLIENARDAEKIPLMESAVYLSQTTRCFTEINEAFRVLSGRIRNLANSAHACDAVMKRQAGMSRVAKKSQLVIVIGSRNSSNARRLGEIALKSGCPKVIFAEDSNSLDMHELESVSSIGLGTATSAPDAAIEGIISLLVQSGFKSEEN